MDKTLMTKDELREALASSLQGQIDAAAVVMSLEGTVERLMAERDTLQSKMDECREAFLQWVAENEKPGPYGFGNQWRMIDGPLFTVLTHNLGVE